MAIRMQSFSESTSLSRSPSISSASSHDELLTATRMNNSSDTQKTLPFKSGLSEERVDVVDARSSRDEASLSLDDLFDANRTSKENKSILMSYELDRMGMGRYQWCVFFLCGAGFFIDLLWAQAFGLISVPLMNEPGFNADSE